MSDPGERKRYGVATVVLAAVVSAFFAGLAVFLVLDARSRSLSDDLQQERLRSLALTTTEQTLRSDIESVTSRLRETESENVRWEIAVTTAKDSLDLVSRANEILRDEAERHLEEIEFLRGEVEDLRPKIRTP